MPRLKRNPLRIQPIVPTGCDRPVSETLPEAVQRIVQALRPDKISNYLWIDALWGV